MVVPVRFRVDGARQAAELTQQEVADAVGVVVMTVSRWCRGATEPSADDIAKLADALGVSRSWLAWGDGAPSADKARTARINAWVKRLRDDERKGAA